MHNRLESLSLRVVAGGAETNSPNHQRRVEARGRCGSAPVGPDQNDDSNVAHLLSQEVHSICFIAPCLGGWHVTCDRWKLEDLREELAQARQEAEEKVGLCGKGQV